MLISSLLQGLSAIVSLPETLWYRDEGATSRPPLVYCCLLPAARTFQWRMGRRYRASAVGTVTNTCLLEELPALSVDVIVIV
jgi:hypothetical protein